MKISSMRYLTAEGFKNVWVNRLMTVASIGVLIACMVLIGLALLISFNVDEAMGNLEKQNVVMVFFDDENAARYDDKNPITDEVIPIDKYTVHSIEDGKKIANKIKELDNVVEVEFFTGDEALEIIKKSMLDGKEQYFEFLDEEGGNPMSCGAKVTLESMDTFSDTVSQIKRIDGVDTIESQEDLAETINSIKNGIAVAGVWIIGILLLISLVIVSNTIRVTMYNRKLQISIMKAVGATNSFIRIPFVIEGILIGLISAIISEGVVYFCYRVAIDTIMKTLGTYTAVKFDEVALLLLAIFAVIGVFAGVFGSVIMISKYLRKEGSEFSAI